MIKRLLIIAPALLLLALSACGKGKGPAPKMKEDTQPVTVEELALRELDEYITVSGKLEGITNITMSSEAAGRVVQLYKKLGDTVRKGERIGRLDNDVYQYRLDQAEAALASAQSALDTAQRNLNYAEESLRKSLISQAEYNSALAAFKSSKSALDGAKANLESARSSFSGSYLTAPESGTISSLNVSVGQYINPGAPLATITDASRLLIKTGIGESQIGMLKKGQKVLLSRPGLETPVNAFVRGFGISPLANGATYPLEIEVPNPRPLMPGQVVSARILANSYQNLLYTSLTNFANEFGKVYAYTVDAGNKAHKKEVALGRIIGENVLIESGLEPGDLIVTSGSENLEDGAKVEIRK